VFAAGLGAKRLELLRAVVPKPKLIGVLINPKNPNFEVHLSDVRAAAREIGQDLLIVTASAEADLDAAFATFVQRRIDGLIVGSDPMFANRAGRFAELTLRSAIPSIYDWRWMVSAGGLMSNGTNINDSFHQMGIYTPYFRVGILWRGGNEDEEAVYLRAVREGLGDFGYVEGKNIVSENRFPAEIPDRFISLAADLVADKVDVLVAITLH
jgi:hypothetical protein